jgi:methyl-accepting chemotaxis protein
MDKTNVFEFEKAVEALKKRKANKESLTRRVIMIDESELDELNKMVKKIVSNSQETVNCSQNIATDAKEIATDAKEQMSIMEDALNRMLEVAEHYKEAYLDARQAWHRNGDMAEILIDAITMNELEAIVIEKVKELMEIEREHDFPEHEEESYHELIHELETHWDFLMEAEGN